MGIISSMDTIVYIDGQNFLYKIADILIDAGRVSHKDEVTKLQIRQIIEKIAGSNVEIIYYGAKVRVRSDYGEEVHQKTKKFSDNSRRVRGMLSSQGIMFNDSGKLKVRDSDICHNCRHQDYRLQEKGVDVGIAVDMVVAALGNQVKNIYLVSSDTDLLPAIRAARRSGAKVTYIGFSDRTTNALVANTDRTEIIRDQEVVDAYDLLNQPPLPLDQQGAHEHERTQE